MLLQVSPIISSQNNFLDLKTLESLAGSSLAVWLVCNAAQNVFNYNPKWLALAISILISYALAIFSADPSSSKYILAFFNGLLIWSTATGGNVIGKGGGTGGPAASFTSHLEKKRGFFDPWV